MGKVIETKYSDVNHRIYKKALKKDKCDKKSNTKPTEFGKSSGLQQIKRKLATSDDEPKSKIVKIRDGHLSQAAVISEDPIIILKRDEITDPNIEIIRRTDSEDVQLTVKESTSDLFFHDELSNSYEHYVNKDFSFHIIDEICLEGLDGITIEALWKRFLMGLNCPLNISSNIKEQIWQLICRNEKIQFFKLSEPRGVLDIYDRFQFVDTDIGVVMELAYELPDIYPHMLVNDPYVQGSCSTFDTRSDISAEIREMCLKDVEKKYDRSLVMVADQNLRRNALLHDASDPMIELQNVEYCVLERIGRSRKHGELTQGNMSISSHFKMDPKSVYHYKNRLSQNNLLSKQFFYIKSMVTDQNKTGRLLHLKRFYHKKKPKQLLVTEQIINIMKQKPDYRIEYSELRKIFSENSQTLSKIIKSPEFRKFVKTDCLYPYRALYPNAKRSEYMRKARPVEKYIKCLELINPYINVNATWYNDQQNSDSEEDEDVEEEPTGGKIYNMEAINEVFLHILSTGEDGCSLSDLKKVSGVDNNTLRTVLRKLVGKNMVNIKKFDRGKQRHLVYYIKAPENAPDVEVDLSSYRPKILSKILLKAKERRKARNQIKHETPTRTTTATTNIDNKLDLKCPFFIRISNESSIFRDQYLKAQFNIPRSYLITLNGKLVQSKHTFQINQILAEINSNLSLPSIKENFEQSYTTKRNVNLLTKLILLKAVLGEITINGDTLNILRHKRKRPVEVDVPKLSENAEKGNGESVASLEKLHYMGKNPSTVFKEKQGDVCSEIVVSTTPPAYEDVGVYPKNKDISERVWSRIQIVLNVVYEKKVFEDIYKMLKVIKDEESKDGYTKKIDRKSLARILKKLVEEGYIKIYKLAICDGKITKTQSFICHPSVNHTDSLIQSAYEQLKWKYFVGTQKKTAKRYVPAVQKNLEEKIQSQGFAPFKETDVMNSISELREMSKVKIIEIKNKYNRNIGRSYGFKPKFIRMRIIHEFLFYLIYCYDKETRSLNNSEVEDLFKSYRIDLTTEDMQKMPRIWCKEISWKMFIPPLPYHKGWIDGWALVCDVILRLPISVLCKIHNCNFEVPELLEILNHPIKRFYLVKDVPETIRNAVLFKRKYLFDIHQTMCRLAYCGLLQFGPEKYKEKDQMFIYLNRRASILDTTTSEPAYHKITNKEYRQISFFFNTTADIDNYWYNIQGISLSTKLNAKQEGQLITLVDVSARPELMRTLKSRTPEEAVEKDNGEIPGDKRGASGLDSSLWSHILRNWFWASDKRGKSGAGTGNAVVGLRKEVLEKVLPQNMLYNELHTFHGPNKVYLHTESKKVKEIKQKKSRKNVPMPLKTSKTLQKITRKIPYRPKKSVRQYLDHLDKIIVKKLGPMRVKWNSREDKILLLCKAASIFLNPRMPKKQGIPYTVIRDVLRRVCPESKNKSSRACQRRMKHHLPDMFPNLEDNISNLYRLKPILNYYSAFVTNLLREKTSDNKPFKLKETQLSVAFVILMSYLVRHQDEVVNILQGNLLNIDHLTEANLQYVETNLVELEESPLKHQDPKDEDDVKKDVLKSVIHSSLGSKTESGWAFQLFKIYQNFSDNLIRDAVCEMKHSQTISFKKLMMKRKENIRWHTPFQLSNIYIYSQSSTFNETTAVEAYKTFLNAKENKVYLDFSQENIESKKYGQLLALNEFFSIWEKVQFKFYLPHSTVILNPHIKDHSELVQELAVRLQTKMRKMVQEGNIEAEQEPEPEPDDYRLQSGDSDITSIDKDTASTSQISERVTVQPVDSLDTDDIRNSPLDLTVDGGNSETINRLKTWVTDCMDLKRERRSPSPEFINLEEHNYQGAKGTSYVGKMPIEPARDNDDNCDGEVEKITASTVKKPRNKEQIPTLEEIKEGMLKYTQPNEERIIPYITDLSSLLNKENFSELNTDEKTLERLKNHFIYQYAFLEEFMIEEFERLEDFYMIEYLQQSMRHQKIWDRIRCQMVVKKPAELHEAFELLEKKGGSESDFDLMKEIIAFVKDRRVLGATGPEIKENFSHSKKNVSLEIILKVLTDTKILLRTGICTITFVHYTYQLTWLIETFVLSCDEQRLLEENTANEQKAIKENIEKHLREKKLIMVKVMPWTKVDGTLSSDNLKMWLCNILSHCLDYPKISFVKLCEKYCYVKPVDIYYLLEILQELNCVEILLYEVKEVDLFSSWELTKESYASFLDKFEDMYIEPNNVSMTCMGSFFQEN